MKIFPGQQSREEYLAAQIERSENKFRYCKVSVHDVRKYRDLLRPEGSTRRDSGPGPIACLGTRNGREVDLFRLHWFGGWALRAASTRLERAKRSFTSSFPLIESIGRSDVTCLTSTSVIGVELNPRASRRDVWVGSFDEMPSDWSAKFAIVFSNAFDQSQDPQRTVGEWRRIVRPGGFLILCFTNDAEPTSTDRVGGLSLSDVKELFGGRLVYFHDRGSRNGYSEVVLQLA